MHGNFRSDERALPDNAGGLDDILPFAAEHAEKLAEIVRQQMPLDTEFLQPVEQLHGGGFADLAIGMADDGDFPAAFDRAGQRQRPHGTAQRLGDDVARVAEPDELFSRQPERVREIGVQPRVNAREGDHRQFVREIRRMQTGFLVAGRRPVVRVNDGFKKSHNLGRLLTWVQNMPFPFFALPTEILNET
jgi:hypothetical protein